MSTYKDFLYYVVGYSKQVLDQFIEKINELVEKGTITDKEGNEIIDKLKKQFDENSQKFEQKTVEYFSKQIEKLNFATEKEVNETQQRLENIEKKIDELLKNKGIQ
jgi:polyhydroxyalkanoate synthesis regulator phasin